MLTTSSEDFACDHDSRGIFSTANSSKGLDILCMTVVSILAFTVEKKTIHAENVPALPQKSKFYYKTT